MNGIQTLYYVLLAIGIVVAISGVLTLAMVVAGGQFRRRELRAVRALSSAPRPTPSDDARVLVHK